MQVGIGALWINQQLIMSPLLDDLPTLHDHDAVGMAYCRKPMGNDDDRALRANPRHVLLDDPFGLIVQRTGGFVENEDTWVAEQRSGDGYALSLPTRQAGAVLTNQGFVAIR